MTIECRCLCRFISCWYEKWTHSERIELVTILAIFINITNDNVNLLSFRVILNLLSFKRQTLKCHIFYVILCSPLLFLHVSCQLQMDFSFFFHTKTLLRSSAWQMFKRTKISHQLWHNYSKYSKRIWQRTKMYSQHILRRM